MHQDPVATRDFIVNVLVAVGTVGAVAIAAMTTYIARSDAREARADAARSNTRATELQERLLLIEEARDEVAENRERREMALERARMGAIDIDIDTYPDAENAGPDLMGFSTYWWTIVNRSTHTIHNVVVWRVDRAQDRLTRDSTYYLDKLAEFESLDPIDPDGRVRDELGPMLRIIGTARESKKVILGEMGFSVEVHFSDHRGNRWHWLPDGALLLRVLDRTITTEAVEHPFWHDPFRD